MSAALRLCIVHRRRSQRGLLVRARYKAVASGKGIADQAVVATTESRGLSDSWLVDLPMLPPPIVYTEVQRSVHVVHPQAVLRKIHSSAHHIGIQVRRVWQLHHNYPQMFQSAQSSPSLRWVAWVHNLGQTEFVACSTSKECPPAAMQHNGQNSLCTARIANFEDEIPACCHCNQLATPRPPPPR
jgi:hypothetical protein